MKLEIGTRYRFTMTDGATISGKVAAYDQHHVSLIQAISINPPGGIPGPRTLAVIDMVIYDRVWQNN